jgi:hypothetical protein
MDLCCIFLRKIIISSCPSCWLFVSPPLFLCSPIKCGQPDITERALVVSLLVYDISARCHGIYTTWSRLFIFFVSLFHSISFNIFFLLFLLFCYLVILVFLSSVLIQLIRSCGAYFSVAKRSSSISWYSYMAWHPEKGDFLSFFLQ